MTITCDELGYKTEIKSIPVNEVSYGEKYPVAHQMRAQKYAELIKSGKKFPAVMVFGKRHKGDSYQVFDGHARVLAHKILGKKRISALITLVDQNGRPVKCERK